MCSNSIYFPEDIWGELKCVTIPEPNVYFIFGRQVEGYAVPQKYTGTTISKKALAYGTARGEMLYFPSGETMNIIEYELARHQLQHAQSEAEQSFLRERVHEIEEVGRIDLSDYFGSYPPPNDTPDGIVEDFVTICNGIYFAKAAGAWCFGICGVIAQSELTEIALQFGSLKKDYLFYDLLTAAIPIYELVMDYLPVRQLIASERALQGLLGRHFPLYAMTHDTDESAAPLSIECRDQPYYIATEYLILPDRVTL